MTFTFLVGLWYLHFLGGSTSALQIMTFIAYVLRTMTFTLFVAVHVSLPCGLWHLCFWWQYLCPADFKVWLQYRSFYNKREHQREHDHCNFSRDFPYESSFVLKAAKRMEIRRGNKVSYDLVIIYSVYRTRYLKIWPF
jgi:hypothetical protein